MRQILATSDPVLITFAVAVLKDAGIAHFVADQHISGAEGGIGAFPRRILVTEADSRAARHALTDAGLAHELSPQVGDMTASDSGGSRKVLRP